jgi:uncharacterized protein YggE
MPKPNTEDRLFESAVRDVKANASRSRFRQHFQEGASPRHQQIDDLETESVVCLTGPSVLDWGTLRGRRPGVGGKEREMKKLLKQTLPLVALLLAAAWLLPASGPTWVHAQDTEEKDVPSDCDCDYKRTLNVSGTGEAVAQPDTAVVTLGVMTEAKEAGDALKENNTLMSAVIEALVESGVATEDIQTQAIRLSPRYERPAPRQGTTPPPELVGFVATNTVEVRVRRISGLGATLDAVVEAGGNQIQGIRFEISDKSELYDQAREAAWADAKNKAEQLAGLAGAELGPVITISESSHTPVRYAERAMAFTADAGVPVEPGTESVQISVQVTWALQDPTE